MIEIHGVLLDRRQDMVVLSYQNNGTFEPASMEAWSRAALQPGAVVVDVGAYTGLYAIAARQRGAAVYAFEPNPANYERLLQNVQNNPAGGLLSCYHAAAGAKQGRCTFNRGDRPRMTSAGTVAADPAGKVRMETIDGLNLPRCDAIKADVEGYEVDVLRGARRTIAAFLPVLILEANDIAHRHALDAELSQYGYPAGRQIDDRNLLYVHPDR